VKHAEPSTATATLQLSTVADALNAAINDLAIMRLAITVVALLTLLHAVLYVVDPDGIWQMPAATVAHAVGHDAADVVTVPGHNEVALAGRQSPLPPIPHQAQPAVAAHALQVALPLQLPTPLAGTGAVVTPGVAPVEPAMQPQEPVIDDENELVHAETTVVSSVAAASQPAMVERQSTYDP